MAGRSHSCERQAERLVGMNVRDRVVGDAVVNVTAEQLAHRDCRAAVCDRCRHIDQAKHAGQPVPVDDWPRLKRTSSHAAVRLGNRYLEVQWRWGRLERGTHLKLWSDL